MNINLLINSSKAEAGQLWMASEDIIAKVNEYDRSKREKYFKIKKGEIIEFRYHSPANFRTKDDLYFNMEYIDFFQKFNLFGKVHEDIRFGNKHSLDQILYANLYDECGK